MRFCRSTASRRHCSRPFASAVRRDFASVLDRWCLLLRWLFSRQYVRRDFIRSSLLQRVHNKLTRPFFLRRTLRTLCTSITSLHSTRKPLLVHHGDRLPSSPRRRSNNASQHLTSPPPPSTIVLLPHRSTPFALQPLHYILISPTCSSTPRHPLLDALPQSSRHFVPSQPLEGKSSYHHSSRCNLLQRNERTSRGCLVGRRFARWFGERDLGNWKVAS